MNITINRETLIKPLQQVVNVVENKQTLSILGNVLLRFGADQLEITATDLEVELIGRVPLEQCEEGRFVGEITVPGKKLITICRALPEAANINLACDKNHVILKSGKGSFNLSTLPPTDFPQRSIETDEMSVMDLPVEQLKNLLKRTHFSIALQDVRVYLNGLYLEIEGDQIRAVGTDGHRLAMHTEKLVVPFDDSRKCIIPRKGVTELLRVLEGFESDDTDAVVAVNMTSNVFIVKNNQFTFSVTLIDAQYPDYQLVIPKNGNNVATISRQDFIDALVRTVILSNEKVRGVTLQFRSGQLELFANNTQHDQAEESILVDYSGNEIDIAFNGTYLLDVLNVMGSDRIQMTFSSNQPAVVLEEVDSALSSLFVIMPLRI